MDFGEIGRILDIFIQRRHRRVFLQRQHGEPLQKHAWCGWNKQALTRASASAAIFEPHCTADVCSVNYISIIGRESFLYSRVTSYEVFLGGYSTLKNDYITFYIHHVTYKCEKKKSFHCRFAKYSFFKLPEKPPHVSVKTVLQCMRIFVKLTLFH